MSSYITVIGGVNNSATHVSGIVQVPTSGLSSSDLTSLEGIVDNVNAAVAGSSLSMTNFDAITGAVASFTGRSATGGLYEVTNTDSTGASTAGTVTNLKVTVPSSVNEVVVQVPGTVSVAGNGYVSTYLIGSQSNAVISTNGSAALLGVSTSTNQIVDAGGNATIYAGGDNQATLSGGLDRFKVLTGNDTVLATGNASVQAGVPTGYAGTLDFINSSSAQATVLGGHGSVTAFGGNAGGLLYGGTGGNNSLIGGNGAVSLVGAGNNDYLLAGGNGATSVTNNDLFAGPGNETLMASASTQNNILAAGAGTDIISSSGSGNQAFFAATGSATMYGSTVSGATNTYFFSSSLQGGGGNDVIENFNSKTDNLVILSGVNIVSVTGANNGNYPNGAALVTLSDNTQITMVGYNANSLQKFVGGSIIT